MIAEQETRLQTTIQKEITSYQRTLTIPLKGSVSQGEKAKLRLAPVVANNLNIITHLV